MNSVFSGIDAFRLADEASLRDRYAELFRRIAANERTLRVFETPPDEKRVTADLNALLKAWPDPAARPPLFGVPVGVKGVFRTGGQTIRCGSLLPPDLFEGGEAAAVTLLRQAGAIVLGITATTEFAYFAPAATCNPLNHAHTPGGSSSGSAAGVAACFFPLAIGTQTVGSVIRPASYCGVTGFKPSFGRIPSDGLVYYSPSVDHVGLFCAAPGEIETVARALFAVWKEEPLSEAPLRLGVPSGPFLDQAPPESLAAFRASLDALVRSAGTKLEIVDAPCLEDIDELSERHSDLIAAELALEHREWFARYVGLYRPQTSEMIRRGQKAGREGIRAGHESQRELRERLHALMRGRGLRALVCPSTLGEADKGLLATGSPAMNLAWSHAGLPSLSVPAGRGPSGLPLGLQIIGPFGGDETVLALGKEVFGRLRGDQGGAERSAATPARLAQAGFARR